MFEVGFVWYTTLESDAMREIWFLHLSLDNLINVAEQQQPFDSLVLQLGHLKLICQANQVDSGCRIIHWAGCGSGQCARKSGSHPFTVARILWIVGQGAFPRSRDRRG